MLCNEQLQKAWGIPNVQSYTTLHVIYLFIHLFRKKNYIWQLPTTLSFLYFNVNERKKDLSTIVTSQHLSTNVTYTVLCNLDVFYIIINAVNRPVFLKRWSADPKPVPIGFWFYYLNNTVQVHTPHTKEQVKKASKAAGNIFIYINLNIRAF